MSRSRTSSFFLPLIVVICPLCRIIFAIFALIPFLIIANIIGSLILSARSHSSSSASASSTNQHANSGYSFTTVAPTMMAGEEKRAFVATAAEEQQGMRVRRGRHEDDDWV